METLDGNYKEFLDEQENIDIHQVRIFTKKIYFKLSQMDRSNKKLLFLFSSMKLMMISQLVTYRSIFY